MGPYRTPSGLPKTEINPFRPSVRSGRFRPPRLNPTETLRSYREHATPPSHDPYRLGYVAGGLRLCRDAALGTPLAAVVGCGLRSGTQREYISAARTGSCVVPLVPCDG